MFNFHVCCLIYSQLQFQRISVQCFESWENKWKLKIMLVCLMSSGGLHCNLRYFTFSFHANVAYSKLRLWLCSAVHFLYSLRYQMIMWLILVSSKHLYIIMYSVPFQCNLSITLPELLHYTVGSLLTDTSIRWTLL